ncbi:MAG: hypothetical protein A3A94_00435 [Candidatus Portnoybacteria bacterium RIFCSPLOWO2_01_FULL_43_11]|uniref:Glycosyl transferase family 1 domain-containing protein n=3 Tax=Candidatus Portnoyibacteriota TaxID=1817913 RepID=A0A1G2FCT7_9BACT|nr:MAG: hypothetical protein A2815_01660 [Candidatus Portnoybacteria bacterium RIFCSPHIGHO2_01_FULL_40_12b]OGZ39205.1 MAG: hypothetical protein A3A94_00435 [Candidatus Portnoybacteria bacterium RIFCSPLOWO2_01_FULL_43_11]OGZ40968.1 MAG: hypothetical protein A3I20_03025 [Candidatus Portnoybacteria bacterium RIFCSPLOWO2_02_FULL_40_15]
MIINKDLKVALVHDYLVRFGGAERVVLALRKIFPEAPIYTLLYDEKKMGGFFRGAEIRTSFLQKFPKFLRKHYQVLAPLMPSAVETLDLREFDLVISSSSAFSKGLVLRPKTVHVCYCHNPTRFLWDYSHEYQSRWPSLKKILFHYLRLWDKSAANRVDYFLANSKITALRIKKYYGREAKVIYPPVGMATRQMSSGSVNFPQRGKFTRGLRSLVALSDTMPARSASVPEGILPSLQEQSSVEYFLIVSQLTPYKRIDLAIEAFNKLELPLVIIGEGKDRKRLESLAKENIKFLGFLPDEIISQYYQNCAAFIFSGEDDFGLAPVEAMSFGKPVLAYRAGGATETILEGMTGEFFDDLASESLADGVRRLKMNLKNYSPLVIKKRAEKFSEERFEKEIVEFADKICYPESDTNKVI